MTDPEIHEQPAIPARPASLLESLRQHETAYPWSVIGFLGALAYLFLSYWF